MSVKRFLIYALDEHRDTRADMYDLVLKSAYDEQAVKIEELEEVEAKLRKEVMDLQVKILGFYADYEAATGTSYDASWFNTPEQSTGS